MKKILLTFVIATLMANSVYALSGCNVVYENVGGATNPNSTRILIGGNFGVTLKDPVWAGHLFLGWYDAATGGNRVTKAMCSNANANGDVVLYARWGEPGNIEADTDYATCNSGTLLTSSGTSNLTAKWTPNTINITWDGNGGSTPSGGASSCSYSSSFNVPATPSRTGYTFGGWALKAAVNPTP